MSFMDMAEVSPNYPETSHHYTRVNVSKTFHHYSRVNVSKTVQDNQMDLIEHN